MTEVQRDPEFENEQSYTGSGMCPCYEVEVRTTMNMPRDLGFMMVDEKWRVVNFEMGKFHGVPNKLKLDIGRVHGFMTWQAANAMSWWLHAAHDFIETRIIEWELKHTEERRRIRAIGEIKDPHYRRLMK